MGKKVNVKTSKIDLAKDKVSDLFKIAFIGGGHSKNRELTKLLCGVIGAIISQPIILLTTLSFGFASLAAKIFGIRIEVGIWVYLVLFLLNVIVYIIPLFTTISYIKPKNNLAVCISITVIAGGVFILFSTIFLLIVLPLQLSFIKIVLYFNFLPVVIILLSGFLQFKDAK